MFNAIKRIRYNLQMLFSTTPWIYIPLYRLLGKHQHLLVGKNTDIVIEGFPRSGNTFSVTAFEWAQDRKIKIAHHLHSPAQLIWAVNHDIPAVALIREPKSAVISLVIRESHISLKVALHEYIRFYQSILPIKDKILTANFEDVITDYGNVIKRINGKFSTDYNVFVHTSDNVEKVFELVQHYAIKESEENTLDENKVARPSENRKKLAVRFKEELENEKYSYYLKQAEFLYNQFI